MIMALLEQNKYLFEINGKFDPEVFREFLKADDLTQNRFIGIIYDYDDYQEYR